MTAPSMTREARRARGAQICTQLKDLFPDVQTALHYTHPFELLFAVILSAQTTDKQVNIVTRNLFKKYTSLADYIHADSSTFENDIKSIGLYRGKARNILATAILLQNEYGGVIPRTHKQLVTLPGVGRKTANVVLGHLYGIAEGIAVDTHLIRLCQKYCLTKYHTAESIEKDLMKIIPQSEWVAFSNRMIWYGRTYCPAHCKSCPSCPLWKCV
ncbi:MAG: endonuclease III [Candidatus Roizmanbacteria bacterium]